MAQRLVRVICPKCKQPYHAQRRRAARRPASRPRWPPRPTSCKGKGCSNCQQTGYRGRLGIFEMMLMNSQDPRADVQGAPTQDIRKAAIAQGMHTLYEDGIDKVLKGITTLEEVFSVAKRTEQDDLTESAVELAWPVTA